MAFSSWRGIIGIIKPTMRPGGLEDMIRILPEGIGVTGALKGTFVKYMIFLVTYYEHQ